LSRDPAHVHPDLQVRGQAKYGAELARVLGNLGKTIAGFDEDVAVCIGARVIRAQYRQMRR
jgi:hypothetical protein